MLKTGTDAGLCRINVICTCQETEEWFHVPIKGTHRMRKKNTFKRKQKEGEVGLNKKKRCAVMFEMKIKYNL